MGHPGEIQRIVGIDSDDSPVRFLQFKENARDEGPGDAAHCWHKGVSE